MNIKIFNHLKTTLETVSKKYNITYTISQPIAMNGILISASNGLTKKQLLLTERIFEHYLTDNVKKRIELSVDYLIKDLK